MKIKAIIFGATGMVGEGILFKTLNHPDVETVLVLGRRSCGVNHPKLKEIIHDDFFDYSSLEEQIKGYNACFFCLGVSSLGMKEEKYTRITYDLTMKAAETLSKHNPEMTFCYISGEGTDNTEKSKLMWARVKGKTENDLMNLPFKAVYNFRPGFIKPIAGLKNAFVLSTVFGKIYFLLKLFFPKHICTLDNLGLAMINAAKAGYKKNIIENEDIVKLASINS